MGFAQSSTNTSTSLIEAAGRRSGSAPSPSSALTSAVGRIVSTSL